MQPEQQAHFSEAWAAPSGLGLSCSHLQDLRIFGCSSCFLIMNSHFTIYTLGPLASPRSISWSGAAVCVISMEFLTAAPPRGRRQNRLMERKDQKRRWL